jgi:molybdopterin molybdotransferase|tara:strand:- start:2875 stop:4128 length:1254 start_codon:yes stop_codon:yes gene_type:complete
MISYKKSKEILRKSKIKIGDEYVDTNNCLDRVTSSNIYVKSNYPLGNNAAFDGYAIKSIDTNKLHKKFYKKFKIIGSIAAGNKPFNKLVKKYEAVEIMTGALIPKAFDTIIPIEKINFFPNKKNRKYILLNKKIPKFEHVRFKGSDYKKNDLLISKGTIIQSNHILALRTLGINKLKVKKKPTILFFSTGNEITNKNKILDWEVRNSNSYYIKSLNRSFLFNFIDGGILRDNQSKLFENKINKMLKSKVDLLITSGAVSAGKFDFVPSVVKSFKLSGYFKSVSIRPGKPVLFAKIKDKPKAIFGLPGNPISSAACFRFFVYPYVKSILGMPEEIPFKAKLKNEFIKKKEFTRFVKSKINTTKNGKLEVKILKGQESFRIKSFIQSNVWVILPSGKSKFKKGEFVDCIFSNHPNKIFL